VPDIPHLLDLLNGKVPTGSTLIIVQLLQPVTSTYREIELCVNSQSDKILRWLSANFPSYGACALKHLIKKATSTKRRNTGNDRHASFIYCF